MNSRCAQARLSISRILSSGWNGVAIIVLWLVVTAVGFGFLADFDSTAGASGETPAGWPAQAGIARTPGRSTVLMFAHPRCPCTRASLTELARIAALFPDQLDVRIFFRLPESASPDWMNTDRWQQAREIPGAHVAGDPNGVLAARFGAKTSGHVLFYDGAGRLLFTGGITAARARTGDSPGGETLIALLRGESAAQPHSAVFGCPLFDACPAGATGETCPTK